MFKRTLYHVTVTPGGVLTTNAMYVYSYQPLISHICVDSINVEGASHKCEKGVLGPLHHYLALNLLNQFT